MATKIPKKELVELARSFNSGFNPGDGVYIALSSSAIEIYKKLLERSTQYEELSEKLSELQGEFGESKVEIKAAKAKKKPKAAAKAKKKPKASDDNNLSNYATQLADINEIFVIIGLYELLKVKIDVKYLDGETYNHIISSHESVLLRSGDQKIIDAVDTKKKQGYEIAKYIFENYKTHGGGIKGVYWVNNSSKFEQICTELSEETVLHNKNPSDIVLFFENSLLFGVSLKASFGKTDIGQYNSSICSFVNGVLPIHEVDGVNVYPNAELSNICPARCEPKILTIGKSVQKECEEVIRPTFYKWCDANIWNSSDNTDGKKDAYKEYVKVSSNKAIALQQREFLLNQCREVYYNKIKEIHGIEEDDIVSDGNSELIKISEENTRLIFANYLRLDIGMEDTEKSIDYTKISALQGDVIEEKANTQDQMINKYLGEKSGSNYTVCFKKIGSGTIAISCDGSKKGVLFRIKFSGTPPSSFKVNGQNFNQGDKLKEGGGVQKGGGINEILNIPPENLSILYDVIDFFFDGLDTHEEFLEKVKTLIDEKDVLRIFEQYKTALEEIDLASPENLRLIRAKTRSLIQDILYDTVGEGFITFINILNLYIDEKNFDILDEMYLDDDELNEDCPLELEEAPQPQPGSLGGGKKKKKKTRNNKKKKTRRTKKTKKRKTKRGACRVECKKAQKVLPYVLDKLELSKEEKKQKLKDHDKNCENNCVKLLDDKTFIDKILGR